MFLTQAKLHKGLKQKENVHFAHYLLKTYLIFKTCQPEFIEEICVVQKFFKYLKNNTSYLDFFFFTPFLFLKILQIS